jgi:hypothetical protein
MEGKVGNLGMAALSEFRNRDAAAHNYGREAAVCSKPRRHTKTSRDWLQAPIAYRHSERPWAAAKTASKEQSSQRRVLSAMAKPLERSGYGCVVNCACPPALCQEQELKVKI